MTPVRLPAQSPNLNAHAERFVGSIRRECLNKLVVLGERHLRMVLRDYIDHYLRERNHQGLGNELLTAPVSPANANAEIRCRERQGGLLKYYHREAAQRLG